MRFITLAAFCAALSVSTLAEAAPNVPLCLAIANNYNNCIRDHQRRAWRQDQWGDDGEDGYRYDDGYYGGHHYRRHRRHHGDAASACAAWLIPMQANHCF